MKLNNQIYIKCTNTGEDNDIEMTYGRHLTVSELVTTLELAKQQVLGVIKDYIKDNELSSDEDIETVYWKMEIGNLI